MDTNTRINAVTSTGQAVEIQPHGYSNGGSARAELIIRFEHPQHGRCVAFATDYHERAKPPAALASVCFGVTGEVYTDSFRCVKRVEGGIAISKKVWDEAIAIAKAEARAIVEAELAITDATSKILCPEGYIACRCLWTNGDLMSGEYETEDGLKVMSGDYLGHDGRWYWVPQADVDSARAKAEVKQAKDTARADAKAAKLEAAIAEASTTGKPVEVERWTEDCDGSACECSTDIMVRRVLPDGSFTTSRTHTH